MANENNNEETIEEVIEEQEEVVVTISEDEIVSTTEDLELEDIKEVLAPEDKDEEENLYFVYEVAEDNSIEFIDAYATITEATELLDENSNYKKGVIADLPNSEFGNYAMVNNEIVEDVDKNKEALVVKLKADVVELIEEKQSKAEELISGKVISEKKRERYKVRSKHCRNITGRNDAELKAVAKLHNTTTEALISKSIEIMTPLAKKAGVSVKDYAERVVMIEKLWVDAIDTFYSLLDTFENKAYEVIDEHKFTITKAIMELGRDVGVSSKPIPPAEILTLAKEQISYIVENF